MYFLPWPMMSRLFLGFLENGSLKTEPDYTFYEDLKRCSIKFDETVSSWLPTVVARVCVQAACGVCGGQSSIGAGFLRVLQFQLPIIPPISPSS
jgi:hypothetical protein